jgi:hypothetical protein
MFAASGYPVSGHEADDVAPEFDSGNERMTKESRHSADNAEADNRGHKILS